MVWLLGVVAVIACGCGRIAFDDVARDGANNGSGDAATDGLFGHDEDGDGIIDVDDRCPHIADTANADTDGDQVGDVCDPEPALANQQWNLFASMTAPIPFSESPAGAWIMNADDWHYSDVVDPAQLVHGATVGNVDVWVGLDVETVGTGGTQAAIIVRASATPYWYGELFDGGAGARISITEATGTAFVARASTPLDTSFPTGAVYLHLAARVGTSFTLWSGATMTTFATPGYTGATVLIMAFGNHSGRVRYIAIVTSQ